MWSWAEMWGLVTCGSGRPAQEFSYFFPQTMGSHERFWREGIIRSECIQERLRIKGGDKGTETGEKEGDGRADLEGAQSWPDCT